MPNKGYILDLIRNNLYTKWKLSENCHTLATEISTN